MLARDCLDSMAGMHAKSVSLILTGPTGETALPERRGFLGFEIDPAMAQIAEQRERDSAGNMRAADNS